MFTNDPKPGGTVEIELTQEECSLLATACFEAHAALEKRSEEDRLTLVQLNLMGNVFNTLWYSLRVPVTSSTMDDLDEVRS